MERTVGLGYITTNTFNSGTTSYMLPVDESVCGMLFDYSSFDEPFEEFPIIEQYFGNGQTVVINNLTEADSYGLTDENFMSGIPNYHITCFYNYIGADAPLYICFTKKTKTWEAIELMQMASGGKLFQIGVWTTKSIWTLNDGKLEFTNLIGNLETAAETITGKVGQSTLAPYPASIILTPNTYFDDNTKSVFDLPDATTLESPKVSVCLVQNDTDEVNAMQEAIGSTVGCLGLIMACLHLAYAEESIGYVAKFNLNKNDDFENAEVVIGTSAYHVSDLQLGNNYATLKGYIMPCEYKGKEAEVFFTGDPTCDDGDYNCIANNRIMHKVRRAINSALMPYLHSSQLLDVSSGALNASASSMIVNDIGDMIDNVMLNSDYQKQIDGRSVNISKSDDIIDADAITIDVSVGIVSSDQIINEQTSYTI